MEVVYKNDNVYTDISGLTLGKFTDRFEAYMRQQFKEMILWGVNPNKVLYGTDWPIASMESYLEFMEELKLPAARQGPDAVRERRPRSSSSMSSRGRPGSARSSAGSEPRLTPASAPSSRGVVHE